MQAQHLVTAADRPDEPAVTGASTPAPTHATDAGTDTAGNAAADPGHAAGPPDERRFDRRTLLRGAVLLGALGAGGVAVAQTLDRRVDLQRGLLNSAFVPGRPLGWRLAVPHRPKGLVLAFHGKGGTSNVWFDVLDAARVARHTGLAVAAIDGRATYWHPRGGSDATSMVMQEFVPMLAEKGLPTERLGLTGVSMGGYGALYLASVLPPERVVGVATMSAALRWRLSDTSSDAFDDETDFEEHSVFARTDQLRTMPIHLSCGTSDRFINGNRMLARVLPHVETVFDAGSHTNAYCIAHWTGSMEWLAERF